MPQNILNKLILNSFTNEPNGLKLLTRLILGMCPLKEYKCNRNFKNCANPSCSCSIQVQSVLHIFLYCHYFRYSKKPL